MATDPRKVFLVQGHCTNHIESVKTLLTEMGLFAMDWIEVVAETHKTVPTVLQIVRKGFQVAQAAVVILNGEQEARPLAPLRGSKTQKYTLQPRPNVLIETGMALAFYPKRTILLEIPPVNIPSDLDGIHRVKMDGSPDARQDLFNRLEIANCVLRSKRTTWMNVPLDFSTCI